jgi:type II secretory pathway pseudopilin PulG
MKRRQESGFSMMEALAAVAILSIALIPLLSLQIQVQRDAAQQLAIRTETRAQRNALALLQDINMMREPVGARALTEEQTLRWRAERQSAVVQTTEKGTGDGSFQVALYLVTVTVDDGDGKTICDFEVVRLGWRPLGDAPNRARPARQRNLEKN